MLLDNSLHHNDLSKNPNSLVIGALIFLFVQSTHWLLSLVVEPIALTSNMNRYLAYWGSHLLFLFIALLQTFILRRSLWTAIQKENFSYQRHILRLAIPIALTLIVSLALSYVCEWYIDKVNKGEPIFHGKKYYEHIRLYGSFFNYAQLTLIFWVLSIKK